MEDARRPLFSIGAVARLLDLRPATLRTWELRYGLVVPSRSAGGQRLYSREQVDQLRFVRDEVSRGSRPGQAHRLLAERLAPSGTTEMPVHVLARGPIAEALLAELLARGGFVIAGDDAPLAVVGVEDDAGAAACDRFRRAGSRVLALVAPDAAEPDADAVLRLPVPVEELIRAAHALARR